MVEFGQGEAFAPLPRPSFVGGGISECGRELEGLSNRSSSPPSPAEPGTMTEPHVLFATCELSPSYLDDVVAAVRAIGGMEGDSYKRARKVIQAAQASLQQDIKKMHELLQPFNDLIPDGFFEDDMVSL